MKEQLTEQLGDDAVFAPLHYNLPRASSLIYVAQQSEESDEYP